MLYLESNDSSNDGSLGLGHDGGLVAAEEDVSVDGCAADGLDLSELFDSSGSKGSEGAEVGEVSWGLARNSRSEDVVVPKREIVSGSGPVVGDRLPVLVASVDSNIKTIVVSSTVDGLADELLVGRGTVRPVDGTSDLNPDGAHSDSIVGQTLVKLINLGCGRLGSNGLRSHVDLSSDVSSVSIPDIGGSVAVIDSRSCGGISADEDGLVSLVFEAGESAGSGVGGQIESIRVLGVVASDYSRSFLNAGENEGRSHRKTEQSEEHPKMSVGLCIDRQKREGD